MKYLKKFEQINERKTTELEEEVMLYLNDLRESGVTNMFGASPYIQEEFGLDRREAKRILTLWMKNFNADGNYEEIKESYDKAKDIWNEASKEERREMLKKAIPSMSDKYIDLEWKDLTVFIMEEITKMLSQNEED